jgi:hypothetical protein
MTEPRYSSRNMVQFVIVAGTAACIGNIVWGNAAKFDELEIKGGMSSLSEAGPRYQIQSAKKICVNNDVTQTKARACLVGGGRKYALGHDPCWHFAGRCTGSGTRQCVVGPNSQSPDAITVTQCCTGGSQYPWIQVCPGQEVSIGCGFCLF